MYCVGLTGNIASGKSTVADCFFTLGIEVISADRIAKQLTSKTQPALQDIIQHFGSRVLKSTGELDRRFLRELIFKNASERLWLENYLHPLIRNKIELLIPAAQSPYCLIEIPLLTDRSHYPYLNRVLLVQAEKKQYIERLTARDSCSQEDALAILNTQANTQTLVKLADDILLNNGPLEQLSNKVMRLHQQYLGYILK